VIFYRPARGRKQLTAQHHPSKSSARRKHAKREKEPWLLVVSPSLKAFSVKVNSGQGRSPYSVIFLARITCRYVVFELFASMLEQAQALLVGYFDSLEGG
jgi:hypothetical protein